MLKRTACFKIFHIIALCEVRHYVETSVIVIGSVRLLEITLHRNCTCHHFCKEYSDRECVYNLPGGIFLCNTIFVIVFVIIICNSLKFVLLLLSKNPANTKWNKQIIITPKRCFDIMITCSLRCVCWERAWRTFCPNNYTRGSCFVVFSVFRYRPRIIRSYPSIYLSGLLHWHWGNETIIPVAVNNMENLYAVLVEYCFRCHESCH